MPFSDHSPRPREPVFLHTRDFKRDPYPVYARLREQGPVHRVAFPSGVVGWLVTGYDAAVSALADPRLSKDHRHGGEQWRRLSASMPEPYHGRLQAHLLHQDPPAHTRMRRHVTDSFSPRRMAALRAKVEEIAESLLDDVVAQVRRGGSADLVEHFAAEFPFLALSEVLGIDADFRARFRPEWRKVVAPVGPNEPGRPAYLALLEGCQDYIAELVAHKRKHPADDLLSALVRANEAGDLADHELSSMIFQLFAAGQEPVTNQITTMTVALLDHPAEFAELARRPELLPGAVEELFRYDGSFEITTWRFFREDSELHGVPIPAGESVIVSLGAANRDGRRFADPDRLDFTRSPNPHLAFGHGIHFCPGAALARIQGQTAISALVRRLPGLRLAVPAADLEWIQAVLGRGVARLPVTFEHARAQPALA
ncbi:cytochrome P450 [Crossiella sp. CA-258035]|uniref:cytochrome P450 family protein n=1 Tax=Crossiella sp. CA-258035 TaxID=2981138 RepID=UPI0024BC1975|nr:cytochrome P450 [Crossiella sp. CA-258035]WHT17764.1 cytochrome P450 [Crossiella sp. CA-258035]